MRATLAVELAKKPSETAIEWYAARCASSRAQGRDALAEAYCREAAALRQVRARSAGETQAAPVAWGTSPSASGEVR